MRTILLLDDNPMVRQTLAMILRCKGGYGVLEAGDETEAVELCDRHASEIDLLIADVMLEGRSGRDIAEQLKKLCPNLRGSSYRGIPESTCWGTESCKAVMLASTNHSRQTSCYSRSALSA